MGHLTAFTSPLRRSFLRAVVFAAAVVISGPYHALAADSPLLAEVHFDAGSAVVTPGGRHKIREAVAAIKKRNPASIQVIGFTDSTGDEAINQKISRDRAENVARLLEEHGVTIPLVVKGKGEKGAPYKIDDNVSEPLNRCVGIIAVESNKPLF